MKHDNADVEFFEIVSMFSNTRPSTSNGSLLLLVGICAISLSSFICVAATPIDTKNVV
ncbi:hypothetical protein Bhyg_11882 [Pseudolycoriella hygida]|uniref:Transmembrane protein n=1 Tax=Pseudolycoriella hygida TaxID=35572 RepID=A0A9Q0MW99_9DIPT|nr:hypothetical protein Bhyg_11882 [Pseudolycoriella hygida]